MIKRSHANLKNPRYRFIAFCSIPIISGLSEIFFFTSSFTFIPFFWRADIRRLQAIAAPPVFSDVLISKTFIKQNHDLNTKIQLFSHLFSTLKNELFFSYPCNRSDFKKIVTFAESVLGKLVADKGCYYFCVEESSKIGLM